MADVPSRRERQWEAVFEDQYGTYTQIFTPNVDQTTGIGTLPYNDIKEAIERNALDPDNAQIRFRVFDTWGGPSAYTGEPFEIADERVVVFPETGKVLVDDKDVALQGKTFHLLRSVAAVSDQLYSWKALHHDVWPGEPYDQKAIYKLRKQISLLRKHIGGISYDLADDRYGAVRTVKGVGVIAVRSLGDTEPTTF